MNQFYLDVKILSPSFSLSLSLSLSLFVPLSQYPLALSFSLFSKIQTHTDFWFFPALCFFLLLLNFFYNFLAFQFLRWRKILSFKYSWKESRFFAPKCFFNLRKENLNFLLFHFQIPKTIPDKKYRENISILHFWENF